MFYTDCTVKASSRGFNAMFYLAQPDARVFDELIQVLVFNALAEEIVGKRGNYLGKKV